jgi:glycerol-3-phosphate dehydrogenase
MKRNIQALTAQDYDLIIVGGGINGAACAWDATLRGLKVALLERKDFGWATSSNSAKIAHSGSRYLQHFDFKRMRESIRERNLLHERAPHLVNSQPYVMPLYGHGIKGRETTAIYFKAYDLCSLDRQWSKDPARRIPNSRIISTAELLKIAPEINRENLTGGVIWYEGQMHNTERLLFSHLRAAAERGAQIANCVEVTGFTKSGNCITGVEAKDLIGGEVFSLKTKAVINASGPWIVNTLKLTDSPLKKQPVHASKALSLLTRPFLEGNYALTFPIRPMYKDRQAVLDKKASLSFAIPWRGYSLIGSLHLSCDEDPDKVTITEQEIQDYIDMINEGYPAAKLTREDVRHVLWGIVPADSAGSAAPLKHYEIVDHAQDEIERLVSVVGVKFTTSRDVAEKTLDLICQKIGKSTTCTTAEVPLWGGDIEYLNEFKHQVIQAESARFSEAVILRLIDTYGSQYQKPLAYIAENPEWAEVVPDTLILKAEVIHAIRDEMATTLSDVVLRRTDLASLEYPGEETLRICAELMAKELGWNESRIQAEIHEVSQAYIVIPSDKQTVAALV